MNLLSTSPGRKALFAALYLSEGAPIGFLWWALPTTLRANGIPVEQITSLLSLLALPWALKFLWAPLIDSLRSHRWTFRSWVLSMQLLMGLSVLPLIWLDPASHFPFIIFILVVHAVSAATQDVSIDAWCLTVASRGERGALNGWMQAGMLAGRSLLGGGALLLEDLLGHTGVLILLILAIWLPALLVVVYTASGSPGHPHSVPRSASERFTTLLKGMLQKKTTWIGLLFTIIAGAGYEAVGAVAGPFLIDRGLSSTQVGWFFAIPAVAGMAAGALLGGFLADRFHRRKMVRVFVVLIAVLITVLAGIDTVTETPSTTILFPLMGTLYLAIGLFTSSSYALLMDLSDPRLAATQFSTFMGGTNICESWSAMVVGELIAAFGYPPAFAAMAIVSLFAIPLIRMLRTE